MPDDTDYAEAQAFADEVDALASDLALSISTFAFCAADCEAALPYSWGAETTRQFRDDLASLVRRAKALRGECPVGALR